MEADSSSSHGLKISKKGRKLFTRSQIDDTMRFWNPGKSKLAALILKERDFKLPEMNTVLYLGGGHGTTVSHLSDLTSDGRIFVVEFGISMANIIQHSRDRTNILPIMEDASNPSNYRFIIPPASVDLLYQDVAQRDQPGILIANLQFLRPGGNFIFMVKLRSIAQNQGAEEMRDEILFRLEKTRQVTIDGTCGLGPYQKDHIAIYGKKVI